MLAKQKLVVSMSLLLVVALSGIYTILGIGMNMSSLDMTRMSGIFSMPEAGSSMNMDMEGKMNMSMPSQDMSANNELPKNMAQDLNMMKIDENPVMEMGLSWSFKSTAVSYTHLTLPTKA